MKQEQMDLVVKIPALLSKLGIQIDNVVSIYSGDLGVKVHLEEGGSFEQFGGTNFTPYKESEESEGRHSIVIESVEFSWLSLS